MRVLVACEFSGVVRDAFAALGHDAWSCDLLPTEAPGQHLQGDVLEYLEDGWDLMIAHPPCTYLCRAGYHWCNRQDSAPMAKTLTGAPRRLAMEEARSFFMRLAFAKIHRICIENPRPISHARLPSPTQVIHPPQFGHGEKKTTCLWLKNLPLLMPTHARDDLFAEQEPVGRDAKVYRQGKSKNRWKMRSRTYQGIALAMAQQWGAL